MVPPIASAAAYTPLSAAAAYIPLSAAAEVLFYFKLIVLSYFPFIYVILF